MRPLLLLLLLPAACSNPQVDPFTRSDMWLPVGVNSRNLAAMVANPDDLVQGRGSTGADSPLAINAVTRLMDGKVKPLPGTSSMSTSVAAPAAGGS
jgi:hypothetical protein